MDLTKFNSTYVPIIDLLISAIGLGAIGVAIYQFRKTVQWNRLQSPFNFVDTADGANLQASLYEALAAKQAYAFPERCAPLSPAAVVALSSDRNAVHAINTFLNHLQNQCTAYHYGLVDRDVFICVHAGRLCWWYTVLAPYIHARRTSYQNPRIWNELEATALTFIGIDGFKIYRSASTDEPGGSETPGAAKTG